MPRRLDSRGIADYYICIRRSRDRRESVNIVVGSRSLVPQTQVLACRCGLFE
jgi:hypothetical protein